MARGVSKPNGSSGKPGTLVKIVVTRNMAVHASSDSPVKRPYKTTKPDTIPIRLNATWICSIVFASLDSGSVAEPCRVNAVPGWPPEVCRQHLKHATPFSRFQVNEISDSETRE